MLNIYKLKKNHIKNNVVINKKGEYAGEIKHYPASTKEWFNSIYSFNKNTIKSLPSADIYVTRLIKSYFSLFSKNFEKKARLYIIRFKRRGINMSKILVGKPEFKHTNDKVIISIYVYNREIIKYIKKLNKIKGISFLNVFLNKLKIKLKNNVKLKKVSLKYLISKQNYNYNYKINTIKNIYVNFVKQVKKINDKYINLSKNSFFKIEKIPMLYIMKKLLVKLRLYLRIKRLIHLNKSKFNSIHVSSFKNILEKVYKKEVQLNIISLKQLQFNSSLLTQLMGKKLRNRKNRLSRVIDKVLTRIDVPFKKRLDYFEKKPKSLMVQNMIVRNYLSNNYIKIIPSLKLIDNKTLSNNVIKKVLYKKFKEDKLNVLLKSFFSEQFVLKLSKNKLYQKVRNIDNTVLDNLKNKVISGIRIEASGRLSKRLIASRAVFKIKHKGTIRNIDSSYKKIPSVLLRGRLTSNVDFSKSKNTTPIGAFGLKGWIGGV